jgi:hypothetical protein
MNDDPRQENAPASAPPPPPGIGEPQRERLSWLFRDALRQQRVHPLMDLLRLYREADMP